MQTTLTGVTGVTGGSRGAIHGPELTCADQGPNSALGVPSGGLTLVPASLLRGSAAHVLMAISPVGQLLAPCLSCLMTLIPVSSSLGQPWGTPFLQLGEGASCGLCPTASRSKP